MAFTKLYSPKDWAKKDNTAISKGANALKRKLKGKAADVDWALTQRFPAKLNKFKSTVSDVSKEVGPTMRYIKRSGKVIKQDATRGIIDLLKKIKKGITSFRL